VQLDREFQSPKTNSQQPTKQASLKPVTENLRAAIPHHPGSLPFINKDIFENSRGTPSAPILGALSRPLPPIIRQRDFAIQAAPTTKMKSHSCLLLASQAEEGFKLSC
jgi:hypothetical protein